MLGPGRDVPEDLKNAVLKSYLVPRFTRIYHEGIFRDSTGAHTARCVEMAKSLPSSQKDLSKLVRMLWIHDLPEIVTSDYSVVQKNSSPKLSKKIQREEMLAAMKILSSDDQRLLIEFNEGLTPIALVAKTIDRTEGNIFFHKELTKWINSDDYDETYVPKDEALTYSFQYYKKSIQSLSSDPNLDSTWKQIIEGFLEIQINSIINAWKNVPQEGIPRSIKEELSNL